MVFDEGSLHIFIEKAICIPNLIFPKLLVFLFIGGPASVTVATVTFFRIERLITLFFTVNEIGITYIKKENVCLINL